MKTVTITARDNPKKTAEQFRVGVRDNATAVEAWLTGLLTRATSRGSVVKVDSVQDADTGETVELVVEVRGKQFDFAQDVRRTFSTVSKHLDIK